MVRVLGPVSQMVTDDWKWIMERQVTTWTCMSGSDGGGTFALSSKVTESVSSALDHLQAMGKGRGEPVYDTTSGGWRWTWEYESNGLRCVDTVRVY